MGLASFNRSRREALKLKTVMVNNDPKKGTAAWYQLKLDNAGLTYSPNNTIAELKSFIKNANKLEKVK